MRIYSVMLKDIILYITLTIISPTEDFDKIIEVNLPFDTWEACEYAATDVIITTDVLFDLTGEQIKIVAKCVDFAELMKEAELVVK